MDQKPKPSETHSSTFPQDSDSEIELRSTHTSPETTTSEESDGTLVDTSMSTTPTPSLSGEDDLDSAEGHSQPIVGTLPLTDKNPPDNISFEGDPQEKHPPPGPSEAEELTSTDTPLMYTLDNPPGLRDNFEKRVQNFVKAREETVTTPPLKESEYVVTIPPSQCGEDSPMDYPPIDQPDAPLGAEDSSVIPPVDRPQCVPPDDPFSRFWSGQTAYTSNENKRRHRWLLRKPEHRHSIEIAELEIQVFRPHRPKFYSRCPDAKGVSFEYVGFILQHIVEQQQREWDKENLECEKKESEVRRQSELPADLINKPQRVILVDPIISPFDSGEDKVPREDSQIPHWSPEHPSTPDPVPKDTP